MARNGSAFDAIIKKYRLKDPALLDLAEIVRTADAGKVPHPRPEGAGLEAAALGFRQVAQTTTRTSASSSRHTTLCTLTASGVSNKAGVSNPRPGASDRTR